jgi:hypothetical protein
LSRLSQLSHEAQQKGQYSAAARCEELIGKEIGMFVDRNEHSFELWDGDPDKLTAEQIKMLMSRIEQAIAAKKAQQAQLPAAEQTVDVMATPGTTMVRT